MKFHMRSHQKRAESLMGDIVRVVRKVGTRELKGGRTEPILKTVYDGKAKMRTHSQYEMRKDSIGVDVEIQRQILSLPIGDFVPSTGDMVIVLDSVDPQLIGRKYQTNGAPPNATLATAYRVYVDELANEVKT